MTMPKPIRSIKTVTKMIIRGVVKNFSSVVSGGIFLKLNSAVDVRQRNRQFDGRQLDYVIALVKIIGDPSAIRLPAVNLHVHFMLIDNNILPQAGHLLIEKKFFASVHSLCRR